MFEDQPSYLGGLTTQLQDSMRGIEYGRSDVNPEGQYVPNNSANGTVYRNVPQKANVKILPNEQDLVRQQQTVEMANRGDVFAIIQTHVDRLSNESKPIEFFGLTMPSKLVESTPDLKQWLTSLDVLEKQLHSNIPMEEQLKDPAISVARLALEFIQPGTMKMDIPSQIERIQKLKSHLASQQETIESQKPPTPSAPVQPTFTDIIQKSTIWARDNLKQPRVKVGKYSVPQFLLQQDKNGIFTEASLNALTKALQEQINAGEDIVIPEESLKVIIPILSFSVGLMPTNKTQLQSMVTKMASVPTTTPTATKVPTAPVLNPFQQQILQIIEDSKKVTALDLIGPYNLPKGMKVTPKDIFDRLPALKSLCNSKTTTALNPDLATALLVVLLNKGATPTVSHTNPYSLVPHINALMTKYRQWEQQQILAQKQAAAKEQVQQVQQATERLLSQNVANTNTPKNQVKDLPNIVAQSLKWAQSNANQAMTTVGAFVFPTSFLQSPDAGMFQESVLVSMLGQTLQELSLGKLTGSVHWDVLETMIPIIAFSSGRFPASLEPKVAIPQLLSSGQELMARHVGLTKSNASNKVNVVNAMPISANSPLVNMPIIANTTNTANAVNTPNAVNEEESFWATTQGKAVIGAGALVGAWMIFKNLK